MRTYKILVPALLMLIIRFSAPAQEMSVEKYIDTYSPLAVEEMNKYKVPASITLAQGILESGSGNSELARHANNHFGIKCHKGWTGKTYHYDDDEKDECFRKYNSAEDSYLDHSQFLLTRERYAFLFQLEVTDYKGWARGLKQAGYATNPRYPDLLIRIIEENELQRFDMANPDVRKPLANVEHKTVKAVERGTAAPAMEAVKPAGTAVNGRKIYENNGVKCVYAENGDTWAGVASEFGIYGWQVRKYNELTGKDELKAGELVYLEKKRSKAAFDYHVVEPGEDMRNISQRYAVKLKSLCRMNGMKTGEEPPVGDVILLR